MKKLLCSGVSRKYSIACSKPSFFPHLLIKWYISKSAALEALQDISKQMTILPWSTHIITLSSTALRKRRVSSGISKWPSHLTSTTEFTRRNPSNTTVLITNWAEPLDWMMPIKVNPRDHFYNYWKILWRFFCQVAKKIPKLRESHHHIHLGGICL